MNDLFRRFGQTAAAQSPAPAPAAAAQPVDMQSALRQLQTNTAAVLQQAGLNVPQNLLSNPRQTVMHLMSTGQVRNPAALQNFIQMMGRR